VIKCHLPHGRSRIPELQAGSGIFRPGYRRNEHIVIPALNRAMLVKGRPRLADNQGKAAHIGAGSDG
jgi:hypothetical protein